MLYFAYGSNLNKEEMKSRCPSAKYVGKGIISGYMLEFRYYLSVKQKADSNLEVGIWEIEDSDLKNLDFYEGYPQLYDRINVFCECEDKKIVNGIIYTMNNNKYSYQNEMPSQTYFNRCLIGYDNCNINKRQLFNAYDKCLF